MFCTTLRRRPSFATIVPKLALNHGLALRESRLDTHDLAIPLSTSTDPTTSVTRPTRALLVILLSPSAVSDAQLLPTLARLQRFQSLTGGRDLAVVFLLRSLPSTNFVSARSLPQSEDERETQARSEGMLAYQKLQAELFTNSDIVTIPLLPLAELAALPDTLQRYAAGLMRPVPKPSYQPSALDVVRCCTATPPMAEHTAHVLLDLFSSIQELATACQEGIATPQSSSPSLRAAGVFTASQVLREARLCEQSEMEYMDGSEKLRRLRDVVGDEECQNVIDFWAEEWVID